MPHIRTASSELAHPGTPCHTLATLCLFLQVGLFEDWTHFETVLRLFRFENQTEGDAYLKSHHPVYYLNAAHNEAGIFPSQPYKSRAHVDNVNEAPLAANFVTHSTPPL